MPAVEIERTPSRAPGYAAIVSLRGEHDMDSNAEIRRALDSIDGDVLLDLSACGFMDSSVIGTLLRMSQQRASAGHRLELVVPPSNRIITRTIEVASLRELVTVHDVLPGNESPRTVQADQT
jgi:anti-anti-sigma factor